MVQEFQEDLKRPRVGHFLDVISKRSEESYNALLDALYKTGQIAVLAELEPRFHSKINSVKSLNVKLKSDDLNVGKIMDRVQLAKIHTNETSPSRIRTNESMECPPYAPLQSNVSSGAGINDLELEEDEKKPSMIQSRSSGESPTLDSNADIYGSQGFLNNEEKVCDSLSIDSIFAEIKKIISNMDEMEFEEVKSVTNISGKAFSLKTKSDFINGPDFSNLERLNKMLGNRNNLSPSNVVKTKEKFNSNLSNISKVVKGESLSCAMILLDATCLKDSLLFEHHKMLWSDALMKIISSIECETLIIMLSLYGQFDIDNPASHPAFASNPLKDRKIKIMICQLKESGHSNHWMLCVMAHCFAKLANSEKCSIDDICSLVCEVGKKSEDDNLISRFQFMELPLP